MDIGKNSENKKNVEIDLKNLIATRLLIQANSGGGKSYLIRRLLEQSHGQVQQIVIDLEGEFSTLREKYDYLLVGMDGEIPANIKTAELLAKKLLELNVSTIIDLSELKHHERILFVKRFLDSLINTPKKLWHPCLVIIDEAHQFCPQQSKSDSTSSVIDLMTRGRKRGFCGILATQRISKLHKDACAEANNRLIGRTGLDVDRKRASEELGFTKKEDEISLRHLEAGQFYAFGSSISKEIVKVNIGNVETTHPEAGQGEIRKTSPTPENIKKVLKDVIDLPKEAEEEIKNLNDYKTKVMELKRQVRILESSKPKQEMSKEDIDKAVARGHREAEAILKREHDLEVRFLTKEIKDLQNIINSVKKFVGVEISKNTTSKVTGIALKNERILGETTPPTLKANESRNIPEIFKSPKIEKPTSIDNEDEKDLGLCAKKIYSLLYQYPERILTKGQVGVYTGYSNRSGSFSNSISQLKKYDLIEVSGNNLKVKELKAELVGEFDFSLNSIINKLGQCEKEIYNILLENPNQEFTKEDIAEQTPSQYSFNSGSFSNAISKLNTFNLIQRTNGLIKLNPELLEI